MLKEIPSTDGNTPSSVKKWVLSPSTSSSAIAYFLNFGSRASRNPSPRRFNKLTVKKIANPGAKIIIHDPVVRPVFRICPQLGRVISPSPKKLIVDSVKMADATPKVADTKTGPMALGRICLKIIVLSRKPDALADATKSRFFKRRNSPRTKRAGPVQRTRAMINMIWKIERFSIKAATVRIKKRDGIDITTSIKR
jgi:hypothetical protein